MLLGGSLKNNHMKSDGGKIQRSVLMRNGGLTLDAFKGLKPRGALSPPKESGKGKGGKRA